ncbi:MAG: response regulator [Bdellovibrionia bacterium]
MGSVVETKFKTILVVDDEDELRQLIAASLVIRGFDVIEASSGTEAFRVYVERKPDLILSDVRMPNGNGAELLTQIRAKGFDVPFILMSGYTDLSREQAVQAGAAALLNKPFNFRAVFELITKMLGPAGDHSQRLRP